MSTAAHFPPSSVAKNRRHTFALLQAIRGMVALFVVVSHSGIKPGIGTFSVASFFTLSGCIMAMLLEEQPSPFQFIKSRIIRTIPLYWAVTLVTAALSLVAPSLRNSGDVPTWSKLAMSLLFIPYTNSTGAIAPIFSLGWTLNFEIYFYLLLALGLALSRRHARLFAGAAMLTLGIVAHLARGDTTARWFLGDPSALQFALGLGLWWLYRRIQPSVSNPWLLLVLPVLVALACVTDMSHWALPGEYGRYSSSLRPTIPAFFIVMTGLWLEQAFQRFPDRLRGYIVRFGDATYAIYVTHLFVVRPLRIGLTALDLGGTNTLPGCIACCVLSTVVGLLVEERLHAPVRRRLRRLLHA